MELLNELCKIIKDPSRISNDKDIVMKHGRDVTSYHKASYPDVVVYPITNKEISDLLLFANQASIPVVPCGAMTSVEGQVVPLFKGISLNLTLMNKIVEIRPKDFLVRVQTGVTKNQLNEALKDYELFFSVNPGADATVGGMAATNASGANTIHYGTMKDQILGMEVVLVDGTIMKTGGMAKKTSSGYNLKDLFVGSEGTLAVFSELTLRVHPIPASAKSIKVEFNDLVSSCNAVVKLIRTGIGLGRIELLDDRTIMAINHFYKTNFREVPTILVDVEGMKNIVEEEIRTVTRVLEEIEGQEISLFETNDAREQLWAIRYNVANVIAAFSPQKKLMTTDVCVPLSILPTAILKTRQLMDELEIYGAILGHVGDGNYHAVIAVDPSNNEEMRKVRQLSDAIVKYALLNGGTCSGEHGIGLGKKKYLLEEHSSSIHIMKSIKTLFDPKHILNPGKLFY
jgi:D-lactate dehydrogenase (cytochrome)